MGNVCKDRFEDISFMKGTFNDIYSVAPLSWMEAAFVNWILRRDRKLQFGFQIVR